MVFSTLKTKRTISYELAAVTALAVMLAVSLAGAMIFVHYANAQQQPLPPTTSAGANPSTNAGGLKFFIKLANNNTSSSQSQAGSNATGSTSSSGGANATKKITINVHVQQGPNGKPATLPITAVVPQNTKLSDLQLCASTGSEQPTCQPLTSATGGKSTLDLTKQSPSSGGGGSPSGGAAATPPAAPPAATTPSTPSILPSTYRNHGSNNYDGLLSYAVFSTSGSQIIADNNRESFRYLPVQSSLLGDQSLIGSVNVPINIDVTAIVPINVDIQNAQVCAQVGGGSCSQVILNPTQSTYSPTTISYAQPTPTVTSTPTTMTPTTTAATQPTSPTTSSTTQPTTTGTPTTTPSTTSPSTSTSSPSTTTSPPTSTTTTPPSTGSGSGTTSSGGGTGSSSGSSGSK
jgi:hypothetical protein